MAIKRSRKVLPLKSRLGGGMTGRDGAIDFSAIAAVISNRVFEGAVVLEILSDDPLHGLTDGVAKLRTNGFAFQETIKQASQKNGGSI